MMDIFSDTLLFLVFLLFFIYPSMILLTLLADILKNKRLGAISTLLTGFIVLLLILFSLKNTEGYTISVFEYFSLRIDVVSITMMLLVSLVEIIYGCYTFKYQINSSTLFPSYIHVVLLGYLVILISSCTDWLTFIVLWEAISFLAYYLILVSGKKYTITYTYFVPLHISGFLLLIAASLLYANGSLEFSTRIPMNSIIPYLLVFGLIAKPGIFPYHFWVQKIYDEINPIHAGLFSSIIDPIGLIGLYRLIYYENLPSPISTLVLVLSIISILISITWYWGCSRLSSVLAWSTIYNMAWIQVLLVVSPISITNYLFPLYLLAHGLAKFSAFVSLAKIGEVPLNAVRLISSAPAFLLGSSLLAIEGVPPFGLFFAKIGVLVDILNYDGLIAVILMFSWIVSSVFFFKLFSTVMFPSKNSKDMLGWKYSIDYLDYLNGFLLILVIISPLIINYLLGGGVFAW